MVVVHLFSCLSVSWLTDKLIGIYVCVVISVLIVYTLYTRKNTHHGYNLLTGLNNVVLASMNNVVITLFVQSSLL